MSLALYDEAFIKKLKNLSEHTDIHIYGVQDTRRFFEVVADSTNDKPLQLPMICLHRDDGYTINEIGNNARSINSLQLKGRNTDTTAVIMNQIPITIQYQVDVYARKFEEADAIMRELVFILTNAPTLIVTVPYQGINYQHRSSLTLSPNIRDNSAVAERLVPGQFSRLTLNCSLNDAHLFDIRLDEFKSINAFSGHALEVVSPDGSIVTEELPLYEKETNN